MFKTKYGSLAMILLVMVVISSLAIFAVAKAEQNQRINQKNNTTTNAKNATSSEKGQLNAEEHKSAVANFVQSLHAVADNEQGGIGQQVRVIAQQQNDSETTTVQALEKIQSRNKIKTFLMGSDYKNLGTLRSEIVTTQNRINQLNNLLPNIQNASDTAEIQDQIQTLGQQQTQINNFITAQENKFSLFGWLAKMFNR